MDLYGHISFTCFLSFPVYSTIYYVYGLNCSVSHAFKIILILSDDFREATRSIVFFFSTYCTYFGVNIKIYKYYYFSNYLLQISN